MRAFTIVCSRSVYVMNIMKPGSRPCATNRNTSTRRGGGNRIIARRADLEHQEISQRCTRVRWWKELPKNQPKDASTAGNKQIIQARPDVETYEQRKKSHRPILLSKVLWLPELMKGQLQRRERRAARGKRGCMHAHGSL